jgi:uncharacterized protein (DUF1330 family)
MNTAKMRDISVIMAAALVLMAALSACDGESATDAVDKVTKAEKPAYLITSGVLVDPEKMPAYLEASAPLFEAAGSEELAFGKVSDDTIHLLEGNWPYEGLVMILKFPSMDVLQKFWHSPAYQEAMKLRDGVVLPNFTIAIEKSR